MDSNYKYVKVMCLSSIHSASNHSAATCRPHPNFDWMYPWRMAVGRWQLASSVFRPFRIHMGYFLNVSTPLTTSATAMHPGPSSDLQGLWGTFQNGPIELLLTSYCPGTFPYFGVRTKNLSGAPAIIFSI